MVKLVSVSIVEMKAALVRLEELIPQLLFGSFSSPKDVTSEHIDQGMRVEPNVHRAHGITQREQAWHPATVVFNEIGHVQHGKKVLLRIGLEVLSECPVWVSGRHDETLLLCDPLVVDRL